MNRPVAAASLTITAVAFATIGLVWFAALALAAALIAA